jgi:hypothetical protein
MNDYIPAVLKKELDKLLIQLVRSHGLSRGARATIFVPGRFGLFQWRLQMACRSSVVSPAEQLALFQLDEGAIGYTFLKTKRRRVEVVPITNIEADKKYNDLSYENKAVIKKNITCILVVSVFHDGQIAGLVAIDSNNINDNIKMEEQDVHNVLFDWLTKRERDIRLLWRLKNNV